MTGISQQGGRLGQAAFDRQHSLQGSPGKDVDLPGVKRFDETHTQGMRAVIQRVSEASVTIGGQVKGAIKAGLVVLVGFEENDSPEDIDWLSGKLVRLRVFNDDQGVMNRSIEEVDGEFLVISQFTLFASVKKGNRPSYSRAASPENAIPLYRLFVRRLTQDHGKAVQSGEFGADMKVRLVNEGPVTIVIDTKERE